MSLEKAIEEIKKMFWGVLKGKFSPDEEEDVKAHLISNLATLTSYVKAYIPAEKQEEYENHFSKAKDVLLKFDSAGPWFRELPEMIDTVYNVITHANMLQIESHRFSGVEENALQFFTNKIDTLEMKVNSILEDLKRINRYLSTIVSSKTFPEIEEKEDTEVAVPEKEHVEEIEVEEVTEREESDIDAGIENDKEPEIAEKEETEQAIEEELEIKTEEQEKIEEETEESIEADTRDLIEGIELASQYEFEQEPFIQTIESEQEALKQLAQLLSALDPGDDAVISPLTEKLISLGDEESDIITDDVPLIDESLITDEGLTDEEIADVHKFRISVSRLSHVLSTPSSVEDAAQFVSSIKETIAHVSQDQDIEDEEKSPLTRLIEAESGDAERLPVQTDDIQNVISHLESRRQKALERIQQLEQALNSEKIDEDEWQELRIKAEQHMLRIEDTLDGYKRYHEKLQTRDS
ncbi:MAG: hypothetical protein V3V41_05045 [Candidatus Heimdallarchaeota archaeon]